VAKAMITTRRLSALRQPRKIRKTKASLAADQLDQLAVYLIKIDNLFKSQLRISALRPAARLLMLIAAHRSVTIKDAMLDSPLSYRAFYGILDALKDKALVCVELDPDDGRVRRLVVGPEFRHFTKLLYSEEQT
jgi:hypothetical protein